MTDTVTGPVPAPMADSYLGDGVYASFDGFNIWLRTQSGNEVALEPLTLGALDLYRRTIDRHYGVTRYAPRMSKGTVS